MDRSGFHGRRYRGLVGYLSVPCRDERYDLREFHDMIECACFVFVVNRTSMHIPNIVMIDVLSRNYILYIDFFFFFSLIDSPSPLPDDRLNN